MAGFKGYADLDAVLRSGKTDFTSIERTSNTNSQASGLWVSFWSAGGSPVFPAIGGTPASAPGGTVYNGATTGALTFNNVSPSKRYLLQASVVQIPGTAAPGGTLLLYDRLVSVGSISLTTATTLTINSSAIAGRYTNGVGVQAWLEFPTNIQGSSVTLSASYTNQAGTAGQTTGSVTFATQAQVNGAQILPIAAGDSGVQSVQSITISAAASTAGVASLVLLKPLAYLNSPPIQVLGAAGIVQENDYVLDRTALTQIFDGANLALMWFSASGSGTQQVVANLTTVWT